MKKKLYLYERTLGKVSPGSVQRTWTWDLKMKEQHEPDQESENKSKQLILSVILWHIQRNISGFNIQQNILPLKLLLLGFEMKKRFHVANIMCHVFCKFNVGIPHLTETNWQLPKGLV